MHPVGGVQRPTSIIHLLLGEWLSLCEAEVCDNIDSSELGSLAVVVEETARHHPPQQ